MSEEQAKTESKNRYISALEGSQDTTSRILLTHIFIEHLLEKNISTKTKNTKKICGKSGLSFRHKLNLSYSFGEIGAQLFEGIERLNGIRNDMAHEFQYKVSDESVVKLGRTIGKKYKEMESNSDDSLELLDRILDHLVGKLSGFVYRAEKTKNA